MHQHFDGNDFNGIHCIVQCSITRSVHTEHVIGSKFNEIEKLL